MRSYSSVHDIAAEFEALWMNVTGQGYMLAAERDIVLSSIVDAYTYAMLEWGVDNFEFKEVQITKNTIANVNFIDLDEFIYKVVPGSVRIPTHTQMLGIVDETSIFQVDPDDVQTGIPSSYAHTTKAGDTNSVEDATTKTLHLKLNDSAASTAVADASSFSNAGVLTGGDNTEDVSAAGKVNNSFELDGAHYVAVPHSSDLCPEEKFSISCWFYILGTGTGDGPIMIKQDATDGANASWGLMYLTGSNELAFNVVTDNDGWSNLTVTGFNPSEKTWYHFVGTYESGSLKMYINGQLYRTVTSVTGNVRQSDGNLNLGFEDAWNDYYFYGRIDEARVYNIVLNQIQVNRLYNSGDGTENAAVEDVNPNIMRLRLWPTPNAVYPVALTGLKFPTDVITNFPAHLALAIKSKAKSLACLGLGLLNHRAGFDDEYDEYMKRIKDGMKSEPPKHVQKRVFVDPFWGSVHSRLPVGSTGASGSGVTLNQTTYQGALQNVQIENLAQGVDITDRIIYPASVAVDITAIGIATNGAPSGIDDDNTVVLTIKNQSDMTVVTKTYNTLTQPPTNSYEDLGALSNRSLAAGGYLKLTLTQNGTANMPSFVIAIG